VGHLIHRDGEVVSEVVVAEDARDRTALVPADLQPQRVAVFAQPGSAELATEVAAVLGGEVLVLPDRDEAKTIAVVERGYLWLSDIGLDRGDLVVGVGGGALTDVAGFVAATYLRGVAAVYVPTTLLGAVDASIGGKTGINVGGKNLAGVFQHPRRVVIDRSVMMALPIHLVREGAAEAFKAGLIGDERLVDLYEAEGIDAPIMTVIDRAVAVKAHIVSADFRESSRRGWLNYGHTVGHAIEVAGGLSHGDAVAIGMVAAGAASRHKLGYADADRQRTILERLGLPVSAPPVAIDEVRRLMALDKKRVGTTLRMTLLRGIGDPVVTEVDDDVIAVALDAVGLG
jgi:3-dehydroquinate synthetase